MNVLSRLIFCFGLCLFCNTYAQGIDLSSPQGQKIFYKAKYKGDFFRLANQFENQRNSLFAGPATAAMVLNALRAQKLRDFSIRIGASNKLIPEQDRKYLNPKRNYVFNRYTQDNIFDSTYSDAGTARETKSKADVLGKPNKSKRRDWGMQLRQLHEIFLAHGTRSRLVLAKSNLPDKKLRKQIIETLERPGAFVVVNFTRQALGQSGKEQISPAAAYDKSSDRILLMDVNNNIAPWSWVEMKNLIVGMRSKGKKENRGYILVSDIP